MEVSLMVPRGLVEVFCGENHNEWQTQRRQGEGFSQPCSLLQWSLQRPLTCFHPHILNGSDIQKAYKCVICFALYLGNENSHILQNVKIVLNILVTKYLHLVIRVLNSHFEPAPVKKSEQTPWLTHCLWSCLESTARLWLCSHVPSPCLRQQMALPTEGGGCRGMVR